MWTKLKLLNHQLIKFTILDILTFSNLAFMLDIHIPIAGYPK